MTTLPTHDQYIPTLYLGKKIRDFIVLVTLMHVLICNSNIIHILITTTIILLFLYSLATEKHG